MERLGDVSCVRIVVIEIAVLAIAGLGLVQERLQDVIRNLETRAGIKIIITAKSRLELKVAH